jgi:Predicted membrane protein (DUF2306)
VTQNVELVRPADGPSGHSGRTPGRKVAGRSRPWWRQPWVIGPSVLYLAFLGWELPPYLTGDPSKVRIHLHPGFGLHYPLLLVHIFSGTIVALTVGLQLIPWIRNHHPRFHRYVGRTYVSAGVLPSALASMAIVPFTPPFGRVGVAMADVLWLTATVIGYVRGRQHRWAEHRRWMLRSFAIVSGINLWGLAIVLVGQYGPVPVPISYLFEAARWFGWVVNLIILQLWLDRSARRPLVLPAETVRSGRAEPAEA